MARFLIDVDGVIADCITLMIKEINERFRTTTDGVLIDPLKKSKLLNFFL